MEWKGKGREGMEGSEGQWRTQDFRMGGVEVLQEPRGWAVWRGIPIPTGGRIWGGGCAPPQKIIHILLLKYHILTLSDMFIS